jgi:DNA helicase-2/ATP-dependent DNA helicase PcrA
LVEHEAAMMEEIVYHAVDLAKQMPDAAFLSEPQFIFVDEFQDLNQLEQEFITQLAERSKLLLVVGDPDQSIYSFKYAHPSGIRDFAAGKGVELHSSLETWRCPKSIVERANQLLLQADPRRAEVLSTPASAIEGEVQLVRKEFQTEEFDYALESIAGKIKQSEAKRILVLVPRRKLGAEFVSYAESEKQRLGIPESIHFRLSAKHEFSDSEQESILLFSLLAKPASMVHWRAYLGCGDDNHFATEVNVIKGKYGSLKAAIEKAIPEDFPRNKKRIRKVCSAVARAKEFIKSQEDSPLDVVLDSLFPDGGGNGSEVRQMLLALKEENDTTKSLYDKFVDHIRTLQEDEHTIRVMTLIGSKGLDADHVFIVGCNAGNMPGGRWSEHITDSQHRDEQRRLLYVGFTRAKQSLTVSWSRRIPFSQSKGHNTQSLRTVTHGGVLYGEVGMSDFLQDLRAIWS